MTEALVPLAMMREPDGSEHNREIDALWVLAAIGLAGAIGFADPRTGLTIAIGSITFVATLLWPSLGLALLVASVPLQETWPASIAGTTLTWTRLLLVCFLAAWLLRLLTGRNRVRTTPVIWAMLAYLAALVLSIVNATDLAAAAGEIYRWGVAAAVLVAGSSTVRTNTDRAAVLLSLVAGVVFSFGAAVYQVVTDTGPATFNQRGLLRAYGLFGEPNPFAAYLAIATLALLAYTLLAIRQRQLGTLLTLTVAIGTGIGFASLALTQSRGGAIGFAAGVAVLVWYIFPRRGRVLLFAGAIVVAAGLLTAFGAPVRTAFGLDSLFSTGPVQVTTDNFAAQERLAHWGAAFRMWLDYPIAGIGAGNIVAHFREYTPEWRFRIPRGHAHNGYLQAAAQAGTIGLICYLALLTAAWARSRRHLARASTLDRRAACAGALAVTAAIAVHGVFEYVHVLSLGIVVSAIWASIEFETGQSPAAMAIHGDD